MRFFPFGEFMYSVERVKLLYAVRNVTPDIMYMLRNEPLQICPTCLYVLPGTCLATCFMH